MIVNTSIDALYDIRVMIAVTYPCYYIIIILLL